MKYLGVMALVFIGFSLGVAPMQNSFGEEQPSSRETIGQRPSLNIVKYASIKAPVLKKAADVSNVVKWAGTSLTSDREVVRKSIMQVSKNQEIVLAFTREVDLHAKVDHSRALVALSLLGEMKSPHATRFLVDYVKRPLPTKGTVMEDGEIIERTAMEMLQSKAVDGLAYMRDKEVDKEVLAVVSQHPSKIVRAQAINALLWNHGDSAEYKTFLRKYVKKGDEIYVDRVRRVAGESAKVFNAKLQAFLRAHPEAIPPAPEKVKGKINAEKEAGVKFDKAPPQL